MSNVGVIARARGQKTDFGAYYDLVGDHIIYFFVPFCLALSTEDYYVMTVCAVMEGVFFVNCCSLFSLSAILEAKNEGVTLTLFSITKINPTILKQKKNQYEIILETYYITSFSIAKEYKYAKAQSNFSSKAKKRKEYTSITMPSTVIEGSETLISFSAFYIFPSHMVDNFYP